MSRPSPYTDKQKAAILEAVKSSRKSGKKWPEVYEAAKAEGFKGGLPYLVKMSRAAGVVRGRRGRKPVRSAAPVAAKRKPGRPKGSSKVATRRPGRPKGSVSTNGAGLSGIESIVKRMVEQRVNAAVSRAVAALETAARELHAL